jgi:hypothetical protein
VYSVSVEALAHASPDDDAPHGWTRQWPQCILLLQLAARCAQTGSAPVCHRLLKRLLECRERMQVAPPAVDSLLSELWYAAVLAARGDLATAHHHATQVSAKARRIHRLAREARAAESHSRCAHLRLKSYRLRARTAVLLRRSEELLARSHAAQSRACRNALGHR